MEPIQQDCDETSNEERNSEQLCPLDVTNIFINPHLNPRVGNAYQVEIPPMMPSSEHLQLLMNPVDSEMMTDFSQSFLVGLPVPIMWVRDNFEDKSCILERKPDVAANANGLNKYRRRKKSHIDLKKRGPKLSEEPLHLGLDDSIESKIEKIEPDMSGELELNPVNGRKSLCPVPGSLCNPWTDNEVDSFLLGLYIFGKNFVVIKKFLEDKEMGDILSFYYGKFYKSDGYCRWSECQHTKSKKCINGRKIFTGWRQQELLSRLLPHVPAELQSTVLEVSKSFPEGKNSLEEYVSYLKRTVGIHALVEAVSIGKGKEDLTGFAMVPLKINQVFSTCPKIPIGKACSSLTSREIINFLTGGFRLSKARCNDIFWEAVWPRLLARGWHSEQPTSHVYIGVKDYLVFLVPGIKKFSRRKLVKGDHYFDCVTDVLRKVASEPKLIELEGEEATANSGNEGNAWVPEERSDPDDQSDLQRPCYLKPRVSPSAVNTLKFMVVDTSYLHDGKLFNFRELGRSLVDFNVTSQMSSSLRGNRINPVEEDEDVQQETNLLFNSGKTSNAGHSKGICDEGVGPNTKFTIVDTSLAHGGNAFKMRELKYSHVDIAPQMTSSLRDNEGTSSEIRLDEQKPGTASVPLNGDINTDDVKFTVMDSSYSPVNSTSEMTSSFKVNEGNSIENSRNEKEPNTAPILPNDGKTVQSHPPSKHNSGYSKQKERIGKSDVASKLGNSDQGTKVSDEKQSKTTIKFHFSRREKPGHPNSLAPVPKRRRLTACVKAETSRVVRDFSDTLVTAVSKDLEHDNKPSDTGNNSISEGVSLERVSLTGFSGEAGLEEKNGALYSHKQNNEILHQPLIDLNLPHDQLVYEDVSSSMIEMEDGRSNTNPNDLSYLSTTSKLVEEPEASEAIVVAENQQINTNTRRHSTRNRPLTTKALEAIATDSLSIKRSRKSQKGQPRETSLILNPSRRARSRIRVHSRCSNVDSGIVVPKEQKSIDRFCDQNTGIVDKPLAITEENWLTGC